jgi:hypothetical protein
MITIGNTVIQYDKLSYLQKYLVIKAAITVCFSKEACKEKEMGKFLKALYV